MCPKTARRKRSPRTSEQSVANGFANAVSKDAFIALWLDHTVTGRDQITHGGVPILHYEGHGQLWSRYPAERTALKTGTRFEQRMRTGCWSGTPTLQLGWNANGIAGRMLWNSTAAPICLCLRRISASAGQLARPGETAATAELKPAIWDVLREVRDDQLYGVDLTLLIGYVYDVAPRGGCHIVVTMPRRRSSDAQFPRRGRAESTTASETGCSGCRASIRSS